MVVLSAAICSKAGRCLLARQFVEMTRLRIEGIMAAFPKLVNSETKHQHTFVETESVRYVYQPVENMYVVLVTTKGSNIIEDLETLRLLCRTVREITGFVSEETVTYHTFRIIFAFEEAITLGYKENVTLEAIRTNLEMESHEEKLHMMIQASKENEAKEAAEKKRKEIKARKKEMLSSGVTMGGIGNPNFNQPEGMSLGFVEHKGGYDQQAAELDRGGDSGYMATSARGGAAGFGDSSTDRDSPRKAAPRSGGLKLGAGLSLKAGKKDNSFLKQMAAEGEVDMSAVTSPGGGASEAMAAPVAVQRTEDAEVVMKEVVSLELDKDGGVNEFKVSGEAHVECFKPDLKLKIHFSKGDRALKAFKLTAPPSYNRGLFTKEMVVETKSGAAFALGRSLMFKWSMSTTDEDRVPLMVRCWLSTNGGVHNVIVEYSLEAEIELRDVTIRVPLGAPGGQVGTPEIVAVDGGGQHTYISRTQQLQWTLDVLNADNATGSLEFNIGGTGLTEESFFPVDVGFQCADTLLPTNVEGVTNAEDGSPVRFAVVKSVKVDRYEVVGM